MSVTHATPHAHRDPEGSRIGMWLFLLTEILLFAGCFLAYAVFRARYAGDFHFAAQELNLALGLVNTLVLLTSSLTMVLAIAALERGRDRAAGAWTACTIALGAAFLVVKGFEWAAKIHHGIYPNSPSLADSHTPGEQVFYGLYYMLTGLHALHVVIGLIVLAVMVVLIARAPRKTVVVEGVAADGVALTGPGGEVLWGHPAERGASRVEVSFVVPGDTGEREARAGRLENAGLYWHLVDVIWIFLFPLFYLIS